MNFLFWLLWILDILLLGFVIAGSNFRAGFGASTDLNSWLTILLVIVVILSIILRFSVKQKNISLGVAAIPFIILFIMYLFDKRTKYG